MLEKLVRKMARIMAQAKTRLRPGLGASGSSEFRDTPVSLKDYRGKSVVLYFYPKDFTRGCERS